MDERSTQEVNRRVGPICPWVSCHLCLATERFRAVTSDLRNHQSYNPQPLFIVNISKPLPWFIGAILLAAIWLMPAPTAEAQCYGGRYYSSGPKYYHSAPAYYHNRSRYYYAPRYSGRFYYSSRPRYYYPRRSYYYPRGGCYAPRGRVSISIGF